MAVRDGSPYGELYRETRLKICGLIRYFFHIQDPHLEDDIASWPDEKIGELYSQLIWVRTTLKEPSE